MSTPLERDLIRQSAATLAGAIAEGEVTSREVTQAHLDRIAEVDAARCSGCRICGTMCPYGAIEYDEEQKSSRVVEASCKACGCCAAACPSLAIRARHFTDEQIFAQIEGVL